MKTNFLSAFLIFVAAVLLTACGVQTTSQEDAPVENDDQAAVFELLGAMQEDVFREAFRSLSDRTFHIYERTEQRGRDAHIEQMVEQILRHTPGSAREQITTIDSLGDFDNNRGPGFLIGDTPAFSELHQHLLPEEPAYASQREAEAYAYQMDPDTTMSGRTVRVASIQAQPGLGDAQRIRRVRLYIDSETDQLVGLFLQQMESGLLFGENTTIDARLRPHHNDEWLPHLLRVHTDLHAAFLPRRIFRTVYAFYDYEE